MHVFAEAAKEAYVLLRSRYRDEPFRLREQDLPKWKELGTKLFNAGIDPFSYMKYVFRQCMPVTGDVYPNQVLSDSMINRYRVARPELIKQLELGIHLQAEALKARINKGRTLTESLDDPMGEFSPVFCYAAAWSQGEHALAETYRESAERAMLFEPEYRRILEAWLPKSTEKPR